MDELIKYVETCGGAQKAAARLACSHQYIYGLKNGKFPITLQIAKAIEADSLGQFRARKLLELT